MWLVLSSFDARAREGVLAEPSHQHFCARRCVGIVFTFEHHADGCCRCKRVAGCDENEKSIGSWFEGTEYVSTGGIAGINALNHTCLRHR